MVSFLTYIIIKTGQQVVKKHINALNNIAKNTLFTNKVNYLPIINSPKYD